VFSRTAGEETGQEQRPMQRQVPAERCGVSRRWEVVPVKAGFAKEMSSNESSKQFSRPPSTVVVRVNMLEDCTPKRVPRSIDRWVHSGVPLHELVPGVTVTADLPTVRPPKGMCRGMYTLG
jgi:hypothetical protein